MATRTKATTSDALVHNLSIIEANLGDPKTFGAVKEFIGKLVAGTYAKEAKDGAMDPIAETAAYYIACHSTDMNPPDKLLPILKTVDHILSQNNDNALPILVSLLLVARTTDCEKLNRTCTAVERYAKNPKLSEDVSDFIRQIYNTDSFSKNVGPIFSVLDSYVDMPTNSVSGILETLRDTHMYDNFETLAKILCTDAVVETFSKMNVNGDKLQIVGQKLAQVCLCDPENQEFIEKATKYLCRFFSSNVDFQSRWDIIFVRDREFILAAHANMDKAGLDPYVYLIADRLYRRSEASLTELNVLFSSRRKAAQALDKHLLKIGVSDPKALSVEEKTILMIASDDLDFISSNIREINEFISVRKGSSPDFNETLGKYQNLGFETLKINSRTIGKITAFDQNRYFKNQQIQSLITALMPSFDAAINALNGTPLFRDGISYGHSLQFASTRIDRLEMDKIRAEWEQIFPKYSAAIIGSLLNGDYGAALELFKTGIMEMGPENRDKLLKAISNIDSKNSKQSKQSYIYAYTLGNSSNAIRISSKTTSACCFLPEGLYRQSALRYANDPGVILVNFSIGKEGYRGRLEDRTVHGVAIAALGMSEGKRVLYVDSIEGGKDFVTASVDNHAALLGMISRYAKSVGSEEVFMYALPHNYTSKIFVNQSKWDTKDAPLELLINDLQYFDSLQSKKAESITVRYHGLSDLARS